MSRKFNKKEIMGLYQDLKHEAMRLWTSRKTEPALKFICRAATWMYNFNAVYFDPELEKLIGDIASSSIPEGIIHTPKENRVVFFDSFGFDNRGLTQQYVRAFMTYGYEILYILENDHPIYNSEIIRELKDYGKCIIKIFETTNHNRLQSALDINQTIISFSPQNIFIHIAPWDVVANLALIRINGATRYNINLTDHAFWLGTSISDYNIEFRGYGVEISLEKRLFSKRRLLNLPFYPIKPRISRFEGFPEVPSDAIIVFCGGSEYKMMRSDDIFFTLMDEILSLSQRVHIMVAGITADSKFAVKVSSMKHANRVHLIGNRKDIYEVFRHCDIFLSSYPFIGGLMTQYAAIHSRPILAYCEDGDRGLVEFMINHKSHLYHSKVGLPAFLEYARHLIESEAFRLQEGKIVEDSIIKENDFNSALKNIIENKSSNFIFEVEKPDYDAMIDFYLDIETQNGPKVRSELMIDLINDRTLSSWEIVWRLLGIEDMKECLRKRIINKLKNTVYGNRKNGY